MSAALTWRGWSRCVEVRIDDRAQRFQRVLECAHEQPVKPLDSLNETAQKNPQVMVGQRFECAECLRPAREKYRPPRAR